VLPGRRYSPDAPLLFFAAQVALARRWAVRQVWWDAPAAPSEDVAVDLAWVAKQLDAARADIGGPVLVVAKSLATLAAPAAALLDLPAAWLTPLLTVPAVAGALLAYPTDQFVLIGTEDPCLLPEVFDALPGRRLLVPGDHGLTVAGDPLASLAGHESFVRAFDEWLAEVPC
jgi:hypothetical protein